MPNAFPDEFSDLEPFAGWALEHERDRYAKRLASTMDELQDSYDAAFPRLEDATTYLDRLDLTARGGHPADVGVAVVLDPEEE